MRGRTHFIEELLELPSYEDRADRRAAFRQSLAALAIEAAADGPGPLDGLNPESLLRFARAAMGDGLFDDLSWLSAPAAAVALYEIAGALPLGNERRDLGRRVLAQLYEGTAATFVAVATRMAAGSGRGLGGAGVHARVSLCAALPLETDVRVGPLALALVSRRELSREWIGAAATGSLPERRLAARLLERAAREAVRRAATGDEQAKRLFQSTAVAPAESDSTLTTAWRALLADRETLVWRHVAHARGMLAGAVHELWQQIENDLRPDLGPTEWRRAATSLTASIAALPEQGVARARALLKSPLVMRDPGLCVAMTWGLSPAAYVEPEAAQEVLEAIVAVSPIAIAETLVELRQDHPGLFGQAAMDCAQAITMSLGAPEADDGLAALARIILRDLTAKEPTQELRVGVHAALEAFVEFGTREAHARAQRALSVAADTVEALEALDASDADTAEGRMSRRTAVDLLRELDGALFESGLLKNLLLLERRAGEEAVEVASIDDLDERIAAWLLDKESGREAPERPVLHATLHLRQLRALLHLIDGESSDFGDDQERRQRVRTRWMRALAVLTARLVRERSSPLRRAIAATVARAFDALVRDGAADAADVLLHAAMRLSDPADLEVLGEASMHPDVSQLLQLYARFASGRAPTPGEDGSRPLARLGALERFVSDIPAGATERTQAIRTALARLTRALAAVYAAPCLSALLPDQPGASDPNPLLSLEDAMGKLSQLAAGAHRRCGDMAHDEASWRPSPEVLGAALARTVKGEPASELGHAVASATQTAYERLPLAVAEVVALVLAHLPKLPIEDLAARSDPNATASVRFLPDTPLPNWLPSRRTIGGFYVHRQLGAGGVGTVFVVSRVEDRHDPNSDRFALKIPDYDATAARSLSEAEFSKMFREEAGALLAIPEHENLARFVTFDAGAKPKPILVMELVEGVHCEALIASGTLTGATAVTMLDGILAGLEAMHAAGVGHLDVKPSNIILKQGGKPVLVDFGLAGRHLRPGCATGCYGAPEVWGIEGKGTALTADVYSFGCLAFEVLTARTLFSAPTDVALISAHLTHDGLPGPIQAMAKDARSEPIAMFLYQCLRHRPEDRSTASALRRELRRLGPQIGTRSWPIAAGP